jgi:hypothetical protein
VRRGGWLDEPGPDAYTVTISTREQFHARANTPPAIFARRSS